MSEERDSDARERREALGMGRRRTDRRAVAAAEAGELADAIEEAKRQTHAAFQAIERERDGARRALAAAIMEQERLRGALGRAASSLSETARMLTPGLKAGVGEAKGYADAAARVAREAAGASTPADASDPLADENRSATDLEHAMRGLAQGPLNVATLRRIEQLACVLGRRLVPPPGGIAGGVLDGTYDGPNR